MENNVMCKLEFSLPENKRDLGVALAGDHLILVIYELDQWLRSEIKYQNKNEYQPVRDKLNEMVLDNGVYNLIFEQ